MPRANDRPTGTSVERMAWVAEQRLAAAVAVEPGRRMCGYRLAGGVYATFSVEALHDPDEDLTRYVMRPEIPIDPQTLGISPVGVTLIERNGVWHIVDWIGEQHYATPEVFMDEVERMGLSRRVSRNLRFDLLTEDSRVLCVHRYGWYGREGPAIFASFPIMALDVVRDPVTNEHERTMDVVRNRITRSPNTGSIPVRLTER